MAPFHRWEDRGLGTRLCPMLYSELRIPTQQRPPHPARRQPLTPNDMQTHRIGCGIIAVFLVHFRVKLTRAGIITLDRKVGADSGLFNFKVLFEVRK